MSRARRKGQHERSDYVRRLPRPRRRRPPRGGEELAAAGTLGDPEVEDPGYPSPPPPARGQGVDPVSGLGLDRQTSERNLTAMRFGAILFCLPFVCAATYLLAVYF